MGIIGPLALAAGYGHYIAVTPELAPVFARWVLKSEQWPLHFSGVNSSWALWVSHAT